MSGSELLVAGLLAVGVAIELLCCIGVLAMREAYDRLHFTGPASTLGPIAIAGAVLVDESFAASGLKALLVAVVLVVTNPLLVHATARAGRVRELGGWGVRPEEELEVER